MLLSFPQKNQQKSTMAKQVLGLGTPASNAGLKAGDVLVQVELYFKCCWLLNLISNAADYWISFQTLNNEHWALFQMLTNEQRVKTTMMFDADQLRQFVRRITLPPNFTSSWSRWWSWSSWCWCRWRASWSPCWPTPRQSSASGHPMWMRNFNSNLNAGQDQANGGTEHEYSFKGSSRSHFEPEGATWRPYCSKVRHSLIFKRPSLSPIFLMTT